MNRLIFMLLFLIVVGGIMAYGFTRPGDAVVAAGLDQSMVMPEDELDDKSGQQSAVAAKTTQIQKSADVQKTDDSKNAKPGSTMTQEYNKLTAKESQVILAKGTEYRGVGKLTHNSADGIYICRQCNAPLYNSTHKFESNCGWPSFDDEIEGAVKRHADYGGFQPRVEIVCENCDGHLGHVFEGERFTDKNVRHCVNSISMIFIKAGEKVPAKIVKKK